MTVPCKTVNVSAPAQPATITAVSCSLSKQSCESPCNLSVTVAWKNTGGIAGTFVPAIMVGNSRIFKTSVNVNPGETTTQYFTVNNLSAGSYNICPDPN